MKFIEVLICAILLSFMGGLFYVTQSSPEEIDDTVQNIEQKQEPTPTLSLNATGYRDTKSLTEPTKYDAGHVDSTTDTSSTVELKPCSQTTTMPCEMSPKDKVREHLEANMQHEGLFYKGEKVTCIYPAIFSRQWSDGSVEEFSRREGVECTVLQASEPYGDDNSQMVKANCTKGLKKLNNVVLGHKLNQYVRWFFADDCYHFVQGDR